MKQILIVSIFFILLSSGCRIFGRLTSTTQIDVAQSFVLGEGNHGRYNANVKNIAQSKIEVFKTDLNGSTQSLGILTKGDSQQYEVPKDTKITFKNLGNSMAYIAIKLVGDTQLSMGYKSN